MHAAERSTASSLPCPHHAPVLGIERIQHARLLARDEERAAVRCMRQYRRRAEIKIGTQRLGTIGMSPRDIARNVISVVLVELMHPADRAVFRIHCKD